MKTRAAIALALTFSLFTSIIGQTPPPATPQNPTNDDEVVRISTNLVQVDAIITDKKGKVVTDLRPEEIEILEDGRPQKITNFSFVSNESDAPQPVAVAPADKYAPPAPPVRLRLDQVRRTIALVVDDLGLSFESTYAVRQALKKFVDKQMQSGDLVAIIRTGGGIGALQQFTSDKRQLYAAIDRVRFSFQGRSTVSAFGALQNGAPSLGSGNDIGIVNGEDADQLRDEIYTVGTLGAVNYVVRGMRGLPGRKSILLMSDGINFGDDPARRPRVFEATRRLTDLANRASVVIYTMDARGLPTLGLNAADEVSDFSNAGVISAIMGRQRSFSLSQDGFKYLSQQTGGFSIVNENDLTSGIKRVLNDQKGYYLIGYRPDESTFDKATGRRKFHTISFKLKRPGLTVRSRPGFYGITNEEVAPPRHTRSEQLLGALTSPFASGGVHLRLTPLFGNDPKIGSFIRMLLHIQARDLTFTDEPDGWHKAVFDLLSVSFGDNGTVVDQMDRIQTIRVRGETHKRALANGFVFTLTIPIKKPGAYQLRTALRDTTSQQVGSASQFIEVPNISKNRLTLSGITIYGIDPKVNNRGTPVDTGKGSPSADISTAKTSEEEIGDSDPQASPAVRAFRRGMILQYDYAIYNAQMDKALGRPQVQTQMRLFRDGNEIFSGQVQPFDPGNQPDLKRLAASGALQLGTDMTPGEYVLQIIVTDPMAKPKYRTATQWIDFEIVK